MKSSIPSRAVRVTAISAASLTGLALTLVGCSGNGGGGGAEGGLATVNVAYTTTSVTDEAPFLVGTAEGFFADHGCQLGQSIQAANGGANALQSVLNGGLDMGEVATNAAIEAVLGGTPITAVGSSPQGAYDLVWDQRPGTGIHSPADLKGKTLGYTSPGSATEDVAHLIINSAHLTADDLKLTATNGMGGGIALLDSGGVDAAMITPITARSKPKGKYEVAIDSAEFIGPYQKGVYIANNDFLKANPEAVKCVLAGLKDAMEFIVSNPDKAAQDVADGDSNYTVEDLRAEFEYANQHGAFDGTVGMNKDGLANVALARKLRTGEDAKIPWSTLFDTSFLPSGVSTDLPSDS